jgi:predicted GNAT family N-acyltransferase
MSELKKMIPTESQDLQQKIHGPIAPEIGRIGEPIKATVSFTKSGNKVTFPTRIWKISPLGVELVQSSELADLTEGMPIDLEIYIGLTSSSFRGLVVTSCHHDRDQPLIGIRLCSPDSEESWNGDERRTNRRWNCSSEFSPTGVTLNPGKFNDFVYFRVIDISSTGMLLFTSLRNKFLVPGMRLEMNLSLPMVGQVQVAVEVVNARINQVGGKEGLSLGVKFVNAAKQVRRALAHYVFQFGAAGSIAELKQSGLDLPQANKVIEFKYVRSEDEYQQVLELRRLAYGKAGKLTSSESVSDIYDTRSRIVIGVYRGRVVATTRLIYNELDDQMEHEEYVTFPNDFPRKDEICEITRVCTHPDFRGSEVLLGLFRYVAITVIQSKRKYILGCATTELLPLYEKLGFRTIGMSYKHAALNNIEHHIIMGDVAAGLSGKGVNPIVWNVVWRDVVDYVTNREILEFDALAYVRVAIYRLFKPLSRLLYRKA